MNVHAHKLVSEIATQMAGAVYDECAKNNAWYAQHPNRRNFVRRFAPEFIFEARASLVDMLQTNISEKEKQEIMDALIDDATVPRGKNVTVQ